MTHRCSAGSLPLCPVGHSPGSGAMAQQQVRTVGDPLQPSPWPCTTTHELTDSQASINGSEVPGMLAALHQAVHLRLVSPSNKASAGPKTLADMHSVSGAAAKHDKSRINTVLARGAPGWITCCQACWRPSQGHCACADVEAQPHRKARCSMST